MKIKLIAAATIALAGACEPAQACSAYLIGVTNFPSNGVSGAEALCQGSDNSLGAVSYLLQYENGVLMTHYHGSGNNGNCGINYQGAGGFGSIGFPSGAEIDGPTAEDTYYSVVCFQSDGTLYGVQTNGCSGGYCSPTTLYQP